MGDLVLKLRLAFGRPIALGWGGSLVHPLSEFGSETRDRSSARSWVGLLGTILRHRVAASPERGVGSPRESSSPFDASFAQFLEFGPELLPVGRVQVRRSNHFRPSTEGLSALQRSHRKSRIRALLLLAVAKCDWHLRRRRKSALARPGFGRILTNASRRAKR